MPLISVIIPAYNAEKTLAETLRSVLSQTFQDLEILVVDDQSTDRTRDIAESIEDDRLSILTGIRAGVSRARNQAIAAARGELITFLDADDLWTPEKLQAQYDALCADPKAEVVYSWIHCIDEQGKFLRRCNEVFWSGDVWERLLLENFIGNGSNVMVRRSALDKVGIFDESLINAQDTDLWIRLARQCHFVVVPKPHILYRISQGSLSSNLLSLERSSLRVIEKALETAPETMQYLRPHLIANLYKYLTYKALNAIPGRHDGKAIFRYLCQVVWTDPIMATRPVVYKGFLQLGIMTAFPAQKAQRLMNKIPQLANTAVLYKFQFRLEDK
jgi:glycosyltransferase involved in cell wall biosynthesis